MAIIEDHDYANTPTWLNTPAIEQEGGYTAFSSDHGISVREPAENAPKRLIRGLFDPDGYEFPANLDSAERAQITAKWWLNDYIDRAMREFKSKVRACWRREATAEECAYLINRVFECRRDGALPYDTNLGMQVFVYIRERGHGDGQDHD